MDNDMLSLLEFEGVLSAHATTSDGLVIAGAGLSGDDAEVVGAAGSSIAGSLVDAGESSTVVQVGSGALHVVANRDLCVVVLSEPTVNHFALLPHVEERLESVTLVFG
jgi:predicted regulator of Ras-like GTPase activity (Roadblock/LC7/MglB family)